MQQQQQILFTPQQYQQISQQPPQLLQYSPQAFAQQVPIKVSNQQKVHVPLKVHRQETVPVFFRQSQPVLKQSVYENAPQYVYAQQPTQQQNVQYIVEPQQSQRVYQNPQQVQYVYAPQQQQQQPQLTYVAKSLNPKPVVVQNEQQYIQVTQPTTTIYTQPEEQYIKQVPQLTPTVYESISYVPKNENTISQEQLDLIVSENKKTKSITHQNYQSFTYSEKVPYQKTIVDYVPVQKIEYVPRERQITDYYDVEYQIDYVPTKVQEKVIEYIPQERIKESIQYKPVARQIIKEPKEIGGEQNVPPEGFYLTSPQVYDNPQPEQMGKMSKSYTYQQPGEQQTIVIKETPFVDQDKIILESSIPNNDDFNNYLKSNNQRQEKQKQAGQGASPKLQQSQQPLDLRNPTLVQAIVTHHTISNRKDFDPQTGTFAKGSPFRKDSNENQNQGQKLDFGQLQYQQQQ